MHPGKVISAVRRSSADIDQSPASVWRFSTASVPGVKNSSELWTFRFKQFAGVNPERLCPPASVSIRLNTDGKEG